VTTSAGFAVGATPDARIVTAVYDADRFAL
jgi:hypothetical protein